MQIIKSKLFEIFPEIIFGFSTKIGLNRREPYYINLSHNVGDNPQIVDENREYFLNGLGLSVEQTAFQKQVHGDVIKFVEKPGFIGESDAMITKQNGIALAISSADCTPIFIYDYQNKTIAAVHSGWRSTQMKILKKTLNNLKHHFSSNPEKLFCFIGPSISQKNYEVGSEVAALFDSKYLRIQKGDNNSNKIFLDVKQANLDMLLEFGIPNSQIEVSPICSYEEKELTHSFRRDGKLSGRALGIIAMKDKNIE